MGPKVQRKNIGGELQKTKIMGWDLLGRTREGRGGAIKKLPRFSLKKKGNVRLKKEMIPWATGVRRVNGRDDQLVSEGSGRKCQGGGAEEEKMRNSSWARNPFAMLDKTGKRDI